MTRRSWLLGSLAPALAPGEDLFNGRDLNGWQRAGNGLWTVEDGAITGRFDEARPGPGYLLTTRSFEDFRLGVEFWISRGGNSGVYVREPQRKWGSRGDERPAHGEKPGYEVQIDYNDPRNFTGALYGVRNASKLAGAEERWNRLEIECRGPRVRVWVEGELVNDYQPARSPQGVIGLQVHGGKPHRHVVRFRRVSVAL